MDCPILVVIMTLLSMAFAQSEQEDSDRESLKEAYRQLPRVNFSSAFATDPSKITYKLYTKEDPDKEIVLNEQTLKCQKIDNSVKTVLLIHGWTADDSSTWYVEAKNNYFHNGPTNVIYIDWSAYGNSSFAVSAANVKPVGGFIASFLKSCMIPPDKIHILGHSMGGQLAGFIGKSYKEMTQKKIGRITGLDPSYRMFSNKDMDKEERLNELDADFVDVVHTNIQVFGFTKPCGHVDFYPNGGSDQPGCPDNEPRENCNHHRSNKFFVESIITRIRASEVGFKENGYNVELTTVEHPRTVVFGEHIDLQDRGVYYFQTSSSKPYLV